MTAEEILERLAKEVDECEHLSGLVLGVVVEFPDDSSYFWNGERFLKQPDSDQECSC